MLSIPSQRIISGQAKTGWVAHCGNDWCHIQSKLTPCSVACCAVCALYYRSQGQCVGGTFSAVAYESSDCSGPSIALSTKNEEQCYSDVPGSSFRVTCGGATDSAMDASSASNSKLIIIIVVASTVGGAVLLGLALAYWCWRRSKLLKYRRTVSPATVCSPEVPGQGQEQTTHQQNSKGQHRQSSQANGGWVV